MIRRSGNRFAEKDHAIQRESERDRFNRIDAALIAATGYESISPGLGEGRAAMLPPREQLSIR
jgi:hypothetical protein